MKIPKREDCIHSAVCRYYDQMCATDCGHFEERENPRAVAEPNAHSVLSEMRAAQKEIICYFRDIPIETFRDELARDTVQIEVVYELNKLIRKISEHFR